MAVSVSSTADPTVLGNKSVTFTDVTFDSSYPTGGESVTASDLGLDKVDFAVCQVHAATGAGVNVANATYDLSNNKILLYDETPAQVANAADVSTTVVRVLAFGRRK